MTSYLSANGSGDAAGEEMATRFTLTTTSMFWLKAIDVSSSPSTGSIVAFGDSITDGTCSTLDGHDRWEDLLALRLALDAAGRGEKARTRPLSTKASAATRSRATACAGAGQSSGLERLDRDVLTHHGVTHVILFMGTNDVRRDASASQVIAGLQDIIKRVKARGLTIIGVTMIPRHNRPPAENNTGWDASKTESATKSISGCGRRPVRCGHRLRQDRAGLERTRDVSARSTAGTAFIPARAAITRWASRCVSICSNEGNGY